MVHAISAADFDRLKRLDTCAVSNAIERLNVRLRNEGFVHDSVRCLFPKMPPTLGYAVTGTIRSSSQPIKGGWYYDRIDWWRSFLAVPAPRVMVLQDVDRVPAFGAFIGEIHANIAAALQCVGCVTNGAVRDLPAVRRAGFQLFAGRANVSHAFAHLVEFGEPVTVGGLAVKPGDLLCGDLHGLISVPEAIAGDVAQTAAAVLERERPVIELCRSAEFSIDRLRTLVRQLS